MLAGKEAIAPWKAELLNAVKHLRKIAFVMVTKKNFQHLITLVEKVSQRIAVFITVPSAIES